MFGNLTYTKYNLPERSFEEESIKHDQFIISVRALTKDERSKRMCGACLEYSRAPLPIIRALESIGELESSAAAIIESS